MFKRLTWYSIVLISVLGFLVLSASFIKALQITGSSNPAAVSKNTIKENSTPIAETPKESNSIKIVIMGDSIAKGTGDEKGKGFSGYLPDYLKSQTPKELSVENIGVDGLKSGGLLEQLQNDNIKTLLADSNIVLISIGGNDIRSLKSLNDNTKEDRFKGIEDNYLTSLKKILTIIRKSSADTYIVFLGLYNPYESAIPSYEDTMLINSWNYDTQQLVEADAKAIFIPTFDIFKFNLNKFLAPDGLHPNSFGYQAISDRIAKSTGNIFNSPANKSGITQAALPKLQ